MRISKKNIAQITPSIPDDAPHSESFATQSLDKERVRRIPFERKLSPLDLGGTETSGQELKLELKLKNTLERNDASVSETVIDINGTMSWVEDDSISSSFDVNTPGFVVQDPFNSAGEYHDINNNDKYDKNIDKYMYGLDDVISDLLKKSPTFKKRVEKTLKDIGVDKIHIAISLYGEHTAGYVRGEDPVIYITPSILTTDDNGTPYNPDDDFLTPEITDPTEVAWILIHELGHLDPRNTGTNGNVFSGASLTADPTSFDHDPQHSQYVLGIMNEYLKNTGKSYEQGTTYLNTGLPANLDDDDYSVDSLFDKDDILDNTKVGNSSKTLRTIYEGILQKLSEGNFGAVTKDLQNLNAAKVDVVRQFENPQEDVSGEFTYKIPAFEWMIDLLVKETFDNRLGEMDTVLEADERLKQNLGNYYNYAKQNGNTTITTSLKTSAKKFFLSFKDRMSGGKVVNPADFNSIDRDLNSLNGQGDKWKTLRDSLSTPEEKNKAIAILKVMNDNGETINRDKYTRALIGYDYDELPLEWQKIIDGIVNRANPKLPLTTFNAKANVTSIANILYIDDVGDVDSDKFYTEQFIRPYVTAEAENIGGVKNFKAKYTLLPNETDRLGKMASSTQADKDKVEMVYRLTTGDTKTLNENALSELYFGDIFENLTFAQKTMIQVMKKAAEEILNNNNRGNLNNEQALEMADALFITAGTKNLGDAFFDYDRFNAFRLTLGKFLDDFWNNHPNARPYYKPGFWPIDLAKKFRSSRSSPK